MTSGWQGTPQIIERPAVRYAGYRRFVPMDQIPSFADDLGKVPGWLVGKGIFPVGAPFFMYELIDMSRGLQMVGGFPIDTPVDGEGEFFYGALPAGRFVSVVHKGHPSQIIDSTRALLAWAESAGLRFDHEETPEGDRWACRLEIYYSDPVEVPDMDDWETELAFKLA
jgi:effector-binding domain-containing protein